MPSLISNLSKPEQRELLEDLHYLNMDEIKAFSKKHAIPYSIWIESTDGVAERQRIPTAKG